MQQPVAWSIWADRGTEIETGTSFSLNLSANFAVLLSKVFDALPEGGAVAVYDTIIDDDRRENAFGLMMSLNMLIETPGGFDYTGETVRLGCAKSDFRKRGSNRLSVQIRW